MAPNPAACAARLASFLLVRLHLAAPEPDERFGQDRAAVDAVVAAVGPGGLVVVLLVLEGGFHLQVAEPPVAVLVVEVVGAVLEEDADVFVLGLADHAGVPVAAANVGEAADVAQHLAEQVRPFPGDGERADATRADTANGPAGGVLAHVVLL